MTYGIAIILAFMQLGVGDDGSKAGRRGNEFFARDELPQAAGAYRNGLVAQEGEPANAVTSGLWNNLGATLFRMGQFEEAGQAFDQSIALSTTPGDVSRAAYNAGNNVFEAASASGGQAPPTPDGQEGAPPQGPTLESALDYYRQALLADPDNQDAKFNYEFVKRRLEEQQQQDQQDQQNSNDQNENQDENQQNQDQQNQGNQQNQGQQDQDDQQQQQGDQQNEGQQDQQPQQQQAPAPDPNKLSREEAERILQALQNEEEDLLRQVLKPQTRPRAVEKDW
ncbi:MAG: tetratricopeptide repeat protein [Rhodothermales bacterium]